MYIPFRQEIASFFLQNACKRRRKQFVNKANFRLKVAYVLVASSIWHSDLTYLSSLGGAVLGRTRKYLGMAWTGWCSFLRNQSGAETSDLLATFNSLNHIRSIIRSGCSSIGKSSRRALVDMLDSIESGEAGNNQITSSTKVTTKQIMGYWAQKQQMITESI